MSAYARYWHVPEAETFTPALAAKHELLYVVLSHPHTGAYRNGHVVGFTAHVPVDLHAPSAFLQ